MAKCLQNSFMFYTIIYVYIYIFIYDGIDTRVEF